MIPGHEWRFAIHGVNQPKYRTSNLKVLSYNILNGGEWRLRKLAAVIQRQNADVVALLEANRHWKAALLARMLGMQLFFGRANSSFHVAWLSRLPVVRNENHRIPGLAKTMLEIEVRWGDTPLRLFATHLAGGADAVHPTEEAPIILDVLAQHADRAHVLVGDLNSLHPDDLVGPPPPGWKLMGDSIDEDPRRTIGAILEAGYTDCFQTLNPGIPDYTYPAEQPWLRLDYIFASPCMAPRLMASGIVNDEDARKASDHFPVWALFQ